MNIFKHNKVITPDDCRFAISPSSIGKFFENPVIWYKEHILGEELFTGSTATVRGTCAHYMAECAATNTTVDKAKLQQDIKSVGSDVDIKEVLDTYEELGNLFVDYVKSNKPTEVETQLCTKIKQGIYVKGTCDARQGSTIIDYKTSSKKPSDTIPFNYFIQMMAYAYMYRAKGIYIDRLRLVYAVLPTKTIPARQFIISHLITDNDWCKIEDTLTLIADTIIKHFEQPELDYLLFKSMQFKLPTKPTLFKD